MCVCVCICICIYIYIYTHIHTYTHTPHIYGSHRQAGADKDKARRDGATPLLIAALKGDVEVVQLLCSSGEGGRGE